MKTIRLFLIPVAVYSLLIGGALMTTQAVPSRSICSVQPLPCLSSHWFLPTPR